MPVEVAQVAVIIWLLYMVKRGEGMSRYGDNCEEHDLPFGDCIECVREDLAQARSELAAAKEEIERLNEEAEEKCHQCDMTVHAGALEAAESALTSERKETERLREALQEISKRPTVDAAPLKSLAKAALQSRQGEERDLSDCGYAARPKEPQ